MFRLRLMFLLMVVLMTIMPTVAAQSVGSEETQAALTLVIKDAVISNAHVPYTLLDPETGTISIAWPYSGDVLSLYDVATDTTLARVQVTGPVTHLLLPKANASLLVISDHGGVLVGFRAALVSGSTGGQENAAAGGSSTGGQNAPPVTPQPKPVAWSFVCNKPAGCVLTVYWHNTDPSKGPSGLQNYDLKKDAVFLVGTSDAFYATCSCA